MIFDSSQQPKANALLAFLAPGKPAVNDQRCRMHQMMRMVLYGIHPAPGYGVTRFILHLFLNRTYSWLVYDA